MGGMSIWHWIIVGGVLLLLFGGKGKVSDLMGDFAKGIKSFKKGMADDDEAVAERKTVVTPTTGVGSDSVRSLDHRSTVVVEEPADQRRAG